MDKTTPITPNLQQIMRQAHQTPFATDLGQATQQEPAKSPRLLDLAKDRLDDRLPPRIHRTTRLRIQLRTHPLLGRRRRRLRSRRGGGEGRDMMPLTLRRDVGIEAL